MAVKKIKVSEKTVAQLRKGTMAGNLAKAKGASPEMKEALTRFYGASRVNAAIGKSGPGSVKKPSPMTPSANSRENRAASPVGNANTREGRKSVPTVKPSGGPGSKKVTVSATRGGPGAKMTGTKTTPKGGPGAKMTKPSTSSPKPKTNKPSGQKPLIDLPNKLGGAKTAMQTKAKTNADLYAKQQKMAQDKKKKLK
jgi:hypothetical protein